MSINSADLQERGMEGKTLPAPLGSSMKSIPGAKGFSWKPKFIYMGLMAALATLAYITIYTLPFAVIARAPSHLSTFKRRSGPREPPEYAQRIYPKEFAVLDTVPPPTEFDGSSLFVPPGTTKESLKAKPFHIYDDSFLDIIGTNPTLTLIADSGTNPLFHEAVVWYTVKDEVLFTQNAGAKAAGTGLNKSAVIEKILLSEAAAVQKHERNQTEVFVVNSTIQVMNPNADSVNNVVILNNFFGRQFNSLNDVSVNPRNGEIYFTDVMYAYLQDFRPAPGLPNQVYRFNLETGLVQVVADGINMPNGITFSPDGRHAYRWDVEDDGTWSNRKLFAYIHVGAADGIHTDSHGNLYAGVGDGIHVFNPSGMLIGKIYLGETSANFNFAGHGRMVICAETHLYYATLGVSGWVPKAKTV
ncbi:gluconolactonase [Cryptococcus deuterogattii MMRL2647]|nr:gluconolactonase [Cryptococcus deuterogattii MMRL2647]